MIDKNQIRKCAAGLTKQQRADALVDVVRAIYESVKFDNPEGDGLDGRWGPEREGIGKVVDAAENWRKSLFRVFAE